MRFRFLTPLWGGHIWHLQGLHTQIVGVAAPAEPCGEKKFFFLQILGGEKLLKLLKSADGKMLGGLRGAKILSVTFRIVFRVLFAFFNRFSCQNKNYSGAISFCRRAALKIVPNQGHRPCSCTVCC